MQIHWITGQLAVAALLIGALFAPELSAQSSRDRGTPGKSTRSVSGRSASGGSAAGKSTSDRASANRLSGSRTNSSRLGTTSKSSRSSSKKSSRPSRERPKVAPKKLSLGNQSKTAKKTKEEKDADAGDESQGIVAKLRAMVKGNLGWIFGGLGTALAGTLTWMFLAGRRRRGSEAFLEPLDDAMDASNRRRSRSGRSFSSTHIRARDVDSRLGSSVDSGLIETDREYALVVEEGALDASGPEVDEKTGKEYADDYKIRELMEKDEFDSAYTTYARLVKNEGSAEIHRDLEMELSEHFLKKRELRKAASILEHHVATHDKSDIYPKVYFNLGYIHVLSQTYNKSRRFFRLFVQSESDPVQVRRAQGILESLETK